MYTIGSLWVLHWSSWGLYQKPSAGASLHPFARRVSTSFLDHLGEKRFFLKLSTIWLGFVSQLYAKVFVQDVYFLFYWILLGPIRRTFGVWPSVLRSWNKTSDKSKHNHFGRLGATTGFATFSNQPHRSTWKPTTFNHFGWESSIHWKDPMPIHCLGGSAGKPSGIDLVLNGFVLRSGASQKPCLQSSTSCPAIRTIQMNSIPLPPLNITHCTKKVHCLLGEPHELPLRWNSMIHVHKPRNPKTETLVVQRWKYLLQALNKSRTAKSAPHNGEGNWERERKRGFKKRNFWGLRVNISRWEITFSYGAGAMLQECGKGNPGSRIVSVSHLLSSYFWDVVNL